MPCRCVFCVFCVLRKEIEKEKRNAAVEIGRRRVVAASDSRHVAKTPTVTRVVLWWAGPSLPVGPQWPGTLWA